MAMSDSCACGAPKRAGAVTCWSCYVASRNGKRYDLCGCGRRMTVSALMCRKCYDASPDNSRPSKPEELKPFVSDWRDAGDGTRVRFVTSDPEVARKWA